MTKNIQDPKWVIINILFKFEKIKNIKREYKCNMNKFKKFNLTVSESKMRETL